MDRPSANEWIITEKLVAAGAGPDGMTFIVAGAKSKPEYDGRESL